VKDKKLKVKPKLDTWALNKVYNVSKEAKILGGIRYDYKTLHSVSFLLPSRCVVLGLSFRLALDNQTSRERPVNQHELGLKREPV